MLTVASSSGHAETVRRLLDAIERRGLTVFGEIDHAAGAREVGMELADEVVVVFGSPRAGTPLMQQDPRIGIELPLRILIWQEGEETLIGYNDPRELASSYTVTAGMSTLEAMNSLLGALASEAAYGGEPSGQ